jgi:hypothetical protein
MKGQKGSFVYFTPRKINTFFISHGIKIYPGYFNAIYDMLRCVAEKVGGMDLTTKRETETTRKSKPIIAIPVSIISQDIHKLVLECETGVGYD